ncbi:unnamed protein product, partial [Vitis vinifera]|uniref:Uncharacterized protein n=1 Tax=Vitis vinifera TaxID=29760 RepID=D7TL99_VITVI
MIIPQSLLLFHSLAYIMYSSNFFIYIVVVTIFYISNKLGLRVSKADFGPSIWGERFVSYTLADDIARGHKEQQAEDLKEEVRRGLMAAAGNPHTTFELF